jgi:hypothetical protein
MATYSETRRIGRDLAATTRSCGAALRRLGPTVRVEVEDETFGLVVARRDAGAPGAAGADERYRWELWPIEPNVTEAKLAIETEGVGFFARGRLKETAEWLFDQIGQALSGKS